MRKKSRSHDDYCALGRDLVEANALMNAALVKMSRMWPLQHRFAKRLQALVNKLSDLRSAVDDAYFADGYDLPSPLYSSGHEKPQP